VPHKHVHKKHLNRKWRRNKTARYTESSNCLISHRVLHIYIHSTSENTSQKYLPYPLFHAKHKGTEFIPSKYDQEVKLLICIREELGSNLNPDTDYPEDFRSLHPSFKANPETVPQIRPHPLPSYIRSNSLFTSHSNIHRYIIADKLQLDK
jgi:hypothetical protein